jgi:hypothetical protein
MRLQPGYHDRPVARAEHGRKKKIAGAVEQIERAEKKEKAYAQTAMAAAVVTLERAVVRPETML